MMLRVETFRNMAQAIAVFVTLVSLEGCVGTLDPMVSGDAAREAGATQSVTDAGTGVPGSQDSGNSVIFRGICDGSAAVRLGNNTILVAYDELNTLFAYSISGGLPTARADLSALLHLDAAGEIDIEAAAVSNGRIWWVGSHGLDRRGDDAPNRRVLFATNVPSPDLGDIKVVTGPLDLTGVLLNSPEVAKLLTKSVRKQPPKEGGINIEGLAVSADGRLIVGFRSPLSGEKGTSGRAPVVSLLPSGESFRVERVDLLDLDDRGVRDIVINGTGYMIVAGPVPSGGRFALYSWSGTGPPKQTMRLEDFNAEGIVDLGPRWLILSDDGKMKRADDESGNGGRECDRIREKSNLGDAHPGVFFRARMLPK